MLRRRIFSSAMASVMALSSIAVVANAEETTAYVKTEADLEKLVNETYGDDWRTDVLSEYGTYSAEKVLDALEAADAILTDADSTDRDFTVAYAMVETTIAKLQIKTAEDLQKLIDDCTKIYESNNLIHEDLEDLKYVEDKYDALVEAYEEAETMVESASNADITDAFFKLQDAKNNLQLKSSVTKADFRKVLKDFEGLLAKENIYETWRLGVMASPNVTTGEGWAIDGKVVSYGVLLDCTLRAVEGKVKAQYDILDGIKNVNMTTNEDIVEAYNAAKNAVAVVNAWTPDDTTKATKSGVKKLLDEFHGVMVCDTNATSAEKLFDAIVALAGNDDKTTKSNVSLEVVNKLDKSVELINYTDYDEDDTVYGIWNVSEGEVGTINDLEKAENGDSDKIKRKFDAAINIKSAKKIVVVVDENGYWTGNVADVLTDASGVPAGKDYVTISAKSKYDITKLINIDADKLDDNDKALLDAKITDPAEFPGTNVISKTLYAAPAGAEVTSPVLQDAVKLAQDYLDEVWGGDIYDIDDAGLAIVETAKGSSKEFALVYRYLYYALNDAYGAAAGAKYTRADVEKLIEDAYDIFDKTGDAAIFASAHEAVNDARKAALTWVRQAKSDKTYKDYKAGLDSTGELYVSSTDAYLALESHVKHLKAEYEALKYSFGDVYDMIADTYAKIDKGDLQPTSALIKALEDTAYALSTVSPTVTISFADWAFDKETMEYEDNAAFSVDREFIPYNRVVTGGADILTIKDEGVKAHGEYAWATFCTVKIDQWSNINVSHLNLKNAYENLIAAVEAQNVVTAKGDVDNDGTAYTVKDALKALKIANKLETLTVDVEVADHNDNDTVDVSDALAILKKANGLA